MNGSREFDGRFKKGICPNPAGRPRKDRSVGSAILDAASAKVQVTENGRRRKIRKLDAAAAQLANLSAAGDLRAGKMLIDYVTRAENQSEAAAPIKAQLARSDQEIVDRFLQEYRAQFLEKTHESDDTH